MLSRGSIHHFAVLFHFSTNPISSLSFLYKAASTVGCVQPHHTHAKLDTTVNEHTRCSFWSVCFSSRPRCAHHNQCEITFQNPCLLLCLVFAFVRARRAATTMRMDWGWNVFVIFPLCHLMKTNTFVPTVCFPFVSHWVFVLQPLCVHWVRLSARFVSKMSKWLNSRYTTL